MAWEAIVGGQGRHEYAGGQALLRRRVQAGDVDGPRPRGERVPENRMKLHAMTERILRIETVPQRFRISSRTRSPDCPVYTATRACRRFGTALWFGSPFDLFDERGLFGIRWLLLRLRRGSLLGTSSSPLLVSGMSLSRRRSAWARDNTFIGEPRISSGYDVPAGVIRTTLEKSTSGGEEHVGHFWDAWVRGD